MIWVAYYDDFSEFALFTEEIECLRFAVGMSYEVAQVEIGRGVREQLREQWAARTQT